MRDIKVKHPNYPGWRLEVSDDGRKVKWHGVEVGPLTLHYEDAHRLVLKEAGHQWYLNQYHGQKYEPAKFIIFRRVSVGPVVYDEREYEYAVETDFDFYIKENKDNLKRLKT